MHIIQTTSWYDGPIEGILLHENHIYAFLWYDSDEDDNRTYALMRLEPYQYWMLRKCDTVEIMDRLPTFLANDIRFGELEMVERTLDKRPDNGFYIL